MNSFFEELYALLANYKTDLSLAGPSTKVLSFIIWSILVILVGVVTQWYLTRQVKLPFPVAAIGARTNNKDIIEDAKRKYPTQPFIIPGKPPLVILPNSMLDEVKNLPDSQISFRAAAYELMLGRYTSMGTPYHHVVESIKHDLSRSVSEVLSGLQDEVALVVDTEFGICEDWTGLKVCGKLATMVARISARIFVGLPLCRDQEWLRITMQYSENIIKARNRVARYPFILRPVIAPFLAECRQLRADRRRAGKMLAPTIAAMMRARSTESSGSHYDEKLTSIDHSGQSNLVSWILGHYKPDEKPNEEVFGQEQLLISFAAIHTTSQTVAQALFDLALYPEYAEELREEVNQVASEAPDGKLGRDSMPKLVKLDSFLKESQRVHPLGMVNMQRLVTAKKGLTLSPSVHLPRGTFVSFAHTRTQHGAELPQPPLDEFHPFRYAELRSIAGEENKHQYVTTGLDSIYFGHGPSACAGRFFASNMIKVMVLELIKRYDIALGSKGEGVGGKIQRPMTLTVGTNFIPDPRADIFFRQR